jgi:hypothetical protein
MPALKNPSFLCLGNRTQTGLFIARTLYPARLPMDVVNMNHGQSGLGRQGTGQRRFSRPWLPDNHNPLHAGPRRK